MSPKKDTIYSDPQASIPPFQFDARVASAFDDMISRSVPYYKDLQTLVLRLLAPYLNTSTTILDCGCATGTSIQSISAAYPDHSLSFIGIDNSQPMLDKAIDACSGMPKTHRAQFLCSDLETGTLPPHDISLLILTLQFLPIDHRLGFLKRLCAQGRSGSPLILIEKLEIPDPTLSARYTTLHHGFKKDQGYSDLEIAQKRDAIDNVLRPLSLEQNLDILAQSGYGTQDIFFKWLNFVGIIAIKDKS